MEASLSALSSRPERSGVEGPAVQRTSPGNVFRHTDPRPGDQTKRNLKPSSSLLSRLKDRKAIGVVDEDAPEKSRTQDTIEPLCIGALLSGSAEEGHAGQFE
jgi:hypothetical protein